MALKSLDAFIEDYIKDEPITPELIKFAIRKYININYTPTKQDKLEKYEDFLYLLAAAVKKNDRETVTVLLDAALKWGEVRAKPVEDIYEQQALENETFYKLTNKYY